MKLSKKVLLTFMAVTLTTTSVKADEFEYSKELEEGMYIEAITENDWDGEIKLSKEMQELNFNFCHYYGIDVNLSYALIYCESGFNEKAVHYNKNGTTDYGLYQFNTCNLKEINKIYGLNEEDLLDAGYNIIAGTWEFGTKCISKYGNTENAVYNYNTGNGKGSNSHSRRVMRYYQYFKERLGDL